MSLVDKLIAGKEVDPACANPTYPKWANADLLLSWDLGSVRLFDGPEAHLQLFVVI